MRRRPRLPDLAAVLFLSAAGGVLGTLGGARGEEPGQELPRIEARPVKGLKAGVAALLLSGREGGDLWAAVLAAPRPGEEGKWSVDFWVELDGARLLGLAGKPGSEEEEAGEPVAEAFSEGSLRVEVHAYALTSSGALKGSSSEVFRIPEELGASLADGGVKYAGRFEVEPGEYELRVLARETRSQRFVLRVLPLTVPARLTPLFADAEGAWIEVGGKSESPSALPVLHAGRPLSARLRISGPEDDEPGVTLHVLDAEKKPLREIETEVAVLPWEGSGGEEVRSFEMSFELPDDLLTGNYFLETAVGGEAPKTPPLQVYVLGLEREERGVVWTDLRRLASLSKRRREALDLAARRRAAKRVAVIAEAYRDVLDRLASGSVQEAVDELGRLETEVLDSGDLDARTWLENAQGEVMASLADVDAESLLPVLFLHRETHDLYVDEGARRLTFHGRERVMAIARTYAAESKSELAPVLASRALSDMGTSLAAAKMGVAGRRMMEEALALDERNVHAILGIGQDHERRGEYAEAVAYLERLVEIDPRSEEGRLRLALSLRRSGEPAAAARHLRRLVDGGSVPWLTALSYQELARILVDGGRFEDAARLLGAGLERLPSESRLYIQLGYVLDRMGETRQARETVRRTPAGRPDSPRLSYSRPLGDEHASDRAAFGRQSMARLAVLARALSRSEK